MTRHPKQKKQIKSFFFLRFLLLLCSNRYVKELNFTNSINNLSQVEFPLLITFIHVQFQFDRDIFSKKRLV